MKQHLLTLLFLAAILTAFGQKTEDLATREMKNFSRLKLADLQSVSSTNYDVGYYRCYWTVDPAVRFISGSVTTHFTMLAQGSSISMDMHTDLVVDSILFRNTKINYQHTSANALQINFPAPLTAGQKDSVRVYYKGIPPNLGFGSFNQFSHANVPVLWTLSEPYGASSWWPCKDVTTDKPDSIDLFITNPVAYVSSSNGLPVARTVSASTLTTHWKHRYPVATYLVAFAVTNYALQEDVINLPSGPMPVVMYAYPENALSFQAAITVAKIGLQGFSTLFTNYPFAKERYAQTQFSWGGGMEHQTNSFIVSPSTGLVAHELAHQWFGDKVTAGSWQDLWLNEGFATYLEYVYTELTNPANKIPQLQSWTNNITSQPGGSVFVTDTNNLNRLFDSRLTYRKGGYLLHMLRLKLGDSTFFRGVRRYLNDPALAYRHALTDDLQRNLEAESGQNLKEFFKDWYFGQGYPDYEASWNQQPNNIVRLQLRQASSHASVSFFEMPVPLQFKNASKDTTLIVNHQFNGQMFTLNPGFAADTVLIDPQLWILSKNKKAIKLANPPGNSTVFLFPNPATTSFTAYFSLTSSTNLQVYNAKGQLVYAEKPNQDYTQVNTTAWPAGIYWLRISNGSNVETRKILVTHR